MPVYMPSFMLDTDISSYIMERSHDAVFSRLQKFPSPMSAYPSLPSASFSYGVELSPQHSARRSQDQAALDAYLRHVRVWSIPTKRRSTTPKFAPPSK